MPTYEDRFIEWAQKHGYKIVYHTWEFAAWMQEFHPEALKRERKRLRDYDQSASKETDNV